jgi:hypothetical protein
MMLLALACALVGGAPSAAAARQIRAAALVAQPAELPGFHFAEREIQSATTAGRYAKQILQDGPKEARKEIVALDRHGFREGVQEGFDGLAGEALSLGMEFSSPAGAAWEYAVSLHEIARGQRATRFSVAGVPGAIGFVHLAKSGPGGYGNVIVRTGRCFFLVGDALQNATSPQQISAAPSAGALALYTHDSRLCA